MEESARKSNWDERNPPPPFELAIVVDTSDLESKRSVFGGDPVKHLVTALSNGGLVVEQVDGANFLTYLKVAAPLEVIGRAAEKLRLRKATNVGLDVVFDWERRDVFCRQPLGGALFSWTERYQCLMSIINSVVGTGHSSESLVKKLQDGGIIKEIMPLHQEQQRKWLLRHWTMRWMDLTSQPIDAVNAYFGAKVATYFAFLGMYTRWLMFPAVLGIVLNLTDQGALEPAVPPIYAMIVVVWAVVFLQFWRRQNASLQNNWQMSYESEELQTIKALTEEQQRALMRGAAEQENTYGANVSEDEARILGREEWLGRIRSLKNSLIAVTCILCVQLPFELLYAHLNKYTTNDILKYILTGIYLLTVQYLTKIGGEVGIALTKSEHLVNKEAAANSMIYKVFGLYFFQSYIGLLYQAILHKDFNAVRSMLAQRLIVSQLMSNVVENLVPYVTYRWAEYKAMKADEQIKRDTGEKAPESHAMEIEKQYLSPKYAASIGNDFEDGLFDDFLELAVQFGMVTMFASAYPLVATFAVLNNLVEIRSDSLKLLVTMRRPVPRQAASIGAWLAIFQNLGVVAIVTNCALLVCLYDDTGRWKIEPGLAAILLLEHLLLLAKFVFSWFVPEEPAWMKARRIKKAFIQDRLSRRLLSMLDDESTQNDILRDVQNPGGVMKQNVS
jgi:anoctamin-10